MGAQLIVREDQVALFVNEGKAADLFTPGTLHAVDAEHADPDHACAAGSTASSRRSRPRSTSSTPGSSPTSSGARTNPVMMRDAEFGMIRMRAFGTYAMRIADAEDVLRERRRHAGPDHDRGDHRPAALDDPVAASPTRSPRRRSRRSTSPRTTTSCRRPAQKVLAPEFASFGLELARFFIENISLPEEVEKRDRPAHEARRPRRSAAAVRADCRPPRRSAPRPRTRAAWRAPAWASAPAWRWAR